MTDIGLISKGSHHDPHSFLGIHPNADGWVVRVLRPLAKQVSITLAKGKRLQLEHLEGSIWQGALSGKKAPAYRVETTYQDGSTWTADDPYRHLPTIGELDLHLIAEGRHEELWRALGSHLHSVKDEIGISHGVAFRVWAPNARAVRVIGDFNHWDGIGHSMRVMGSSGVWELFVPEISVGTKYKFEIL
ncbi:MAG: hypothetical protein RIT51_794, partial [Actinomycetota bacterium]